MGDKVPSPGYPEHFWPEKHGNRVPFTLDGKSVVRVGLRVVMVTWEAQIRGKAV
jgi:hypothetical protein